MIESHVNSTVRTEAISQKCDCAEEASSVGVCVRLRVWRAGARRCFYQHTRVHTHTHIHTHMQPRSLEAFEHHMVTPPALPLCLVLFQSRHSPSSPPPPPPPSPSVLCQVTLLVCSDGTEEEMKALSSTLTLCKNTHCLASPGCALSNQDNCRG